MPALVRLVAEPPLVAGAFERSGLLAGLALLLAACGSGTPASLPAGGTSSQASTSPSPGARGASAEGAPRPAGGSGSPAPSSRVTVKVGYSPNPSTAPLDIAIKRGYFDQVGIAVETVAVGGGVSAIPPLSQNQIQVATGSVSASLYNALTRGVDIKIVADYGHAAGPTDRTISLMVRKDLMDSGAVKSFSDLKDRSLSVGPGKGSIDDVLLAKALEKNSPNMPLKLEYLGTFEDTLTTMGNKGVDAGFILEPLVTAALDKSFARVLLTGGEIASGTQYSTVMFSGQFAKDQPDVGARYITALLRGVRDYDDAFVTGKDKAAVIKLVTQTTILKDPRVWETFSPVAIDPNGKLSVASMKDSAPYWARQGLLTGGTPDFDKYVDTRFADAAVKQLGPR